MQVITPSTIVQPRGLTNAAGLRRFRQALSDADSYVTRGIARGGIDVLCIGDSIGQGYHTHAVATKNHTKHLNNWFRLFAKRLQGDFNPSPNMGGWGYLVGNMDTSYSFDLTGLSATSAGTVLNGIGYDDTALQTLRIASAASKANRVAIRLGGYGHPLNSSDLEFVFREYGSATSLLYDLNAGSAAGTGSGDIASGTVATAAGSTTYGKRSSVVTFDQSQDTYLQAAGNSSGTNPLFLNGVILYRNDYYTGVRCHNLACASQTSTGYAGTADGTPSGGGSANTGRLQANIDNWCTQSATIGGAIDTRLIILELGTNDFGTGNSGGSYAAVVSLQQYYQNMKTIISRAISQPSAPSILLYCPVPPKIAGLWAHAAGSKPEEYRAAMRQLVAEFPDDVAMFDACDFYGVGYNSSAYATLYDGKLNEDDIHPPTDEQPRLASAIYTAATGLQSAGA